MTTDAKNGCSESYCIKRLTAVARYSSEFIVLIRARLGLGRLTGLSLAI